MSSSWLTACSRLTACIIATASCAEEASKTDQSSIARESQQAETAADAGMWMPTSFTCTPPQPQNTMSLSMIPAPPPMGPGVGIFRQVGGECAWNEPAQVVLHNSSEKEIEITALGLDDPHFAVEPIELPYKVPAGDVLALNIAFRTELGSFNAKLSVESSDGCMQFPVRAKGMDPSKIAVLIHEPYVVNFGHVAAGTLSEPIEFTVFEQPVVGMAAAKVDGFNSTSPSFRVEQRGAAEARACVPVTAAIRFMAPSKPGLARAQLAWTFEGENAAIAVTEMVAFVDFPTSE